MQIKNNKRNFKNLTILGTYTLCYILFAVVTLSSIIILYSFETKQKFEEIVDEQTIEIQQRFEAYNNLVYATRGLFTGSAFVTQDEWNSYNLSLNAATRYPGITGVGYAAIITDSDLSKFYSDYAPYLKKNYGFDLKIYPQTKKGVYYPIIYTYPFDKNFKATGFDLNSESMRSEAIGKAIALGTNVATHPLNLIQGSNKEDGIIIYLPIYKANTSVSTEVDRKQNIQGVVSLALEIGKFMDKTYVQHKNDEGTYLEMYHTTPGKSEALLYSSEKFDKNQSLLQAESKITIADEPFVLRFYAVQNYGQRTTGITAFRILLVALGILGIAGFYLVFRALPKNE